jgi:hypothetical protein
MRDVQDHRKDEDCTVDPQTGTCIACGVEHGDPCPECGGRAYHEDRCRESDEEEEADPAIVLESALMELLDGEDREDGALDTEKIRRIESFEDAGMLTRDRGLVVTMTDGTEFQITIVRSRRARD